MRFTSKFAAAAGLSAVLVATAACSGAGGAGGVGGGGGGARAIGQIFDFNLTGRTSANTPQNFLPPKYKDVDRGADGSQLPASLDLNPVIAALSQVFQNSKEADDTRREAAFALGAVRQPAAAAMLRSYLNSPDPYLAEISKEALLKIENKQ